jgi:hypothetical protein
MSSVNTNVNYSSTIKHYKFINTRNVYVLSITAITPEKYGNQTMRWNLVGHP